MRIYHWLATAGLLASASVALAQPAAPGPDRNADATRQQVIERVDARFARLDLNNDGRFTPEEARQAGERRRAERAGQVFDRIDANRDGSVTRAEFDSARTHLRAQRAERRGQRPHRMMVRRMPRGAHGPGGPGGHGGPGGPGMQHRGLFGEQGFITREQMRERALAHFDRLDGNRDGTVTATERQQAREQMRERMHQRHQQPQPEAQQ